MTKWDQLTEDEQLKAIELAFSNATELDLRRFRKICQRREGERLTMTLPEWVLSIVNRDSEWFVEIRRRLGALERGYERLLSGW